MRCIKILIILFFSSSAYSQFINLGVVKKEQGKVVACSLANKLYKETNSLYEKAYYYGSINSCFYYSEKYRNLSVDEKKEAAKKRGSELAGYVERALNSDEEVDDLLLDLLGVSEHYPKLFERLEKKKIKVYMERPAPTPSENEGDVHSVSYFVASDYKNMIHRYLENDMLEEAKRLAYEYAQYPWAGGNSVKSMLKEIDNYKVILEKSKKNNIVEKADPKKVIAPLVAYQEMLRPKEPINPALIAPSENQVEKNELEVDSNLEKYGMYILAFTLVLGIFIFNLVRNIRVK